MFSQASLTIPVLLIAYCMSVVLQNVLAYRRYRNVINPISLLNVLFFLHNWSYSLGSYFNDSIPWKAPLSVDYSTQADVLGINLICLWTIRGYGKPI